jgi:hypothetical protein
MPLYWSTNDENVPLYEYDYIYGGLVLNPLPSEQPEHEESEPDSKGYSDYGVWSDDE